MQPMNSRLHAISDLVVEWKSFQSYLSSLGHTAAADYIDRGMSQVSKNLHARGWPPIWWRFLTIDAVFQGLSGWFHRADTEGHFFGNGSDGYTPERDGILKWSERLNETYRATSKSS